MRKHMPALPNFQSERMIARQKGTAMFTKEQIVVSGSILQNDTNNSGNTLVSREYSKKREEKKGK